VKRPSWPTIGILALVIAHLVLKVVVMPMALPAPLYGDQTAYADGGRVIANAVRDVVHGAGLPTADLEGHVVARGWFMPGMSLLLAPLFLLDPTAGTFTIRVYLGILSSVLFLAGVWAVSRTVGRRYAAVLLVIPGLIPMWVLFGFSAWGDAWAGMVILLMVPLLVRMWRRLDDGGGVRVRDAALLGLALISILYLRSSALPLVAAVLVLAVVAVLCRARGRRLVRSLAACAVAGAVVVALLAPWSIAASRTLDDRVTTTTTMPISLAYTFGDGKNMCFGPCPPGSQWPGMVNYSMTVADQTGLTALEVQRQMRDWALRDLTPASYATQVLENFKRYVVKPAAYESRFRPEDQVGPTALDRFVVVATSVTYFAGLALAVLGTVAVAIRPIRRDRQVVALLASLLAATLMSQPFVHVSTGRYWPVFAPLLGLAAAGLLAQRDRAGSSIWLRRLQIVGIVGWVAVIGGLFLVAG
jgi:hypothetical protein